LAEHEFLHEGTAKITTKVDETNIKSQRVMEKAGVKKINEDLDPKRQIQGVPIRRFIYELTKDDWLKSQDIAA
jgi:RimJ/RimL family protein N-acetyltransferase